VNIMNLHTQRKLTDKIAIGLSLAAMSFGLFWLVWILWTTLGLGVSGLSLDLFTKTPRRPAQSAALETPLRAA
jgi:phosphate transport system permease protein